MSDDKPEPPKPPEKPSTKTSTVPLKKETVRITLRARPETGAVPPPPAASPPAPKPPAAPPAAPAPPAPPTAAKTQPLRPAPPAAPAPPAGAKTVPLTPAPPTSKVGGAPVAQPTARLTPAPPAARPASPGTRPLPKATVKLQPTQPMTSGPPTGAVASAPLSTGTMTLEEDSTETGLVPFAVIALVLALAAFTIELVSSQRIVKQDPTTETPGFAVPHPDLKRRAGSAGVRVEKPKTGEEFEVDLRYDFAQSMKGAIPIKTYDQFKADQNK